MMKVVVPVIIALALVFAMWQLPAWDQGVEKVRPDEKPRILQRENRDLPPGHPPIGESAPAGGQAGATMTSPGATGGLGTPSAGGAMPGSSAGSTPGPGGGPMSAPGGGPMSQTAAGATETGVDLPLPLEGLGSVHELQRALGRIESESDRKAFESAFRLTFTADRQRRNFAEAESGFRELLTRNPDLAEAYRGLAYAEFNRSMDFPRTIELYEKAVQLDPDYGEAHYALAFMLGPSDPEKGRVHFQRAMDLGVKDERNLRQRFFSGER